MACCKDTVGFLSITRNTGFLNMLEQCSGFPIIFGWGYVISYVGQVLSQPEVCWGWQVRRSKKRNRVQIRKFIPVCIPGQVGGRWKAGMGGPAQPLTLVWWEGFEPEMQRRMCPGLLFPFSSSPEISVSALASRTKFKLESSGMTTFLPHRDACMKG